MTQVVPTAPVILQDSSRGHSWHFQMTLTGTEALRQATEGDTDSCFLCHGWHTAQTPASAATATWLQTALCTAGQPATLGIATKASIKASLIIFHCVFLKGCYEFLRCLVAGDKLGFYDVM